MSTGDGFWNFTSRRYDIAEKAKGTNNIQMLNVSSKSWLLNQRNLGILWLVDELLPHKNYIQAPPSRQQFSDPKKSLVSGHKKIFRILENAFAPFFPEKSASQQKEGTAKLEVRIRKRTRTRSTFLGHSDSYRISASCWRRRTFFSLFLYTRKKSNAV